MDIALAGLDLLMATATHDPLGLFAVSAQVLNLGTDGKVAMILRWLAFALRLASIVVEISQLFH